MGKREKDKKILNIVVNNKKARWNYEILDTETTGIMLEGTEMKPLRNNEVSISEAYVYLDETNNSVIIKNMYIGVGKTCYTHVENRDRKLLMTKHQIKKWLKRIKEGGLTVVPLKGFFNAKNVFKMEIGLARGKKQHDKRNSLKEKESKRKMKEYEG